MKEAPCPAYLFQWHKSTSDFREAYPVVIFTSGRPIFAGDNQNKVIIIVNFFLMSGPFSS